MSLPFRLLPALLLVCLLHTTLYATPLPLTPLRLSNQSPTAALCGLPVLGPARVLAPAAGELRLGLDLASNFTLGSNSREQLIFDGESYHWQLGYSRGLGRGWEAGLELNYLDHRGGFLDNFIVDWHNFFQLPQGGRDTAPKNRLDYVYRRDGQTLLQVDSDTAGIGDVRLLLGRQLLAGPDRALALRASLELPTGDSDKLLGSGSWDAALWLTGEQLWNSEAHRFALFWGAGLLGSDRGDLLPDQRRQLVGLGHLGLAWSPLERLILQLQLDAHSALFKDSSLRQLNQVSTQLGMGGQVALSDATRLELAVVEDTSVDTAPDVVFHLLLAHRF